MPRNIVRNLLFSVTAVLLVGTSLMVVRLEVHAGMNSRAALSGHAVPLISHAHFLQAADANQTLDLSIGLQVRNSTDLDSLLSAVYDPQSTQYHQYLTPDEFRQLFAPTDDQVQQVIIFLQSQGLSVSNVGSNNLLIDATGSVAQVQQAFSTRINTYQLGGRSFYANATPPTIPSSLSDLIASISGLDDSIQYHPLYSRLTSQTMVGQTQKHAIQQQIRGGVKSSYGPKELMSAYDAGPLQSTGILGDNQTVAVFELDGYQPSDIAQYLRANNLDTPSITNVLVDGFSGSAGQGALEAELDIEIIAAMAPHANQIVYEGPNTTQGLNDTYNKIVTDNKAQIASISWGLCEASTGVAELHTMDTIFKQGAAQGITFFSASGDSGAFDCHDTNLSVDAPASDPYVTSVGGTNLRLNSGAYGSESVWSDPSEIQLGPKGGGGGGGISNTFRRPTWQTGPGTQNRYSNGNREVPDVSADADSATGYTIYCTVVNAGCSSTGWKTVGGTSAAAAFWSGSTALINQYLQTQGKKRIGFANPALYGLFKAQQAFPAFHDVTTSANLFYPATVGYDLASGIGSPDIYNLARDLAGITALTTPSLTPTDTPTLTPTLSPTPTDTPIPSPTDTPTPTPTITPTPTDTPTPLI